MIKNVIGYLQSLIQRLREAFRIEKFSIKEEIKFWNIATEFLSQNKPSNFEKIIHWVDIIYEAPVHLVYRLRDHNKLLLVHRHVIDANKKRAQKISHKIEKKRINNIEEIDEDESDILSLFEQQLNNIEGVIEYKDKFKSVSSIKLSIGVCECLPLYDDDTFWGIYCVGPFITHPKRLDAKITVVARTISKLLLDIEEHEKKNIDHFEIEENQNINSFGISTLDIEKIGHFFIQYFTKYFSALGGVILKKEEDQLMEIVNHNLSNDLVAKIREAYYFNNKRELISNSETEEKLKEDLKRYQINSVNVIPYSSNDKYGFIFLGFNVAGNKHAEELRPFLKDVAKTFGSLVHFEDENRQISDNIIHTYYKLLRGIEKSKEETYYHTPRVEALAKLFAQALGLDSKDRKILQLSAQLHDIGYVGAVELDDTSAVGVEIRHPVIGARMVNMLPINQEVLNGIRMHHEWVNGSGTPNRLSGNDISWTGKVIGIIEFITEFIENNQNNQDENDQELYDQLINELVERTDNQFDIVIVPIAINIIKMFEWDDLLRIGTS